LCDGPTDGYGERLNYGTTQPVADKNQFSQSDNCSARNNQPSGAITDDASNGEINDCFDLAVAKGKGGTNE
jgi:hypothetical protein